MNDLTILHSGSGTADSFQDRHAGHDSERTNAQDEPQSSWVVDKNVDDLSIDLSTSRMLSERSTIWARRPHNLMKHRIKRVKMVDCTSSLFNKNITQCRTLISSAGSDQGLQVRV